MKKIAYLIALLAYFLFMTPALVSAQADDDLVVGVNLVNQPALLTPQEQDTILDNMKNAGVRVIRAGIADNEKNLDFAQRVYAHGMKLLWFCWGIPSPSGNMILSSADPDKFRAYFQPLLTKLEDKGIVLVGLELGNEINWSNHDLGQSGTGRVLTLADLKSDPKGQQVAKGYLQYVKLLAVLKDIRDHSKLNQHTPIISAGSGELDYHPKGRDAVSLKAMIQFLRANGMDKYVDAYGVHWYPQGQATPAQRLASLRLELAECGSASSGGKPGWMTEWGLPVSTGPKCPVVDDKRTVIFSELRNDFRQFAQQGRLKAIILYTWQGDFHQDSYHPDPYGAFMCGAVTKSGLLAVAPLSVTPVASEKPPAKKADNSVQATVPLNSPIGNAAPPAPPPGAQPFTVNPPINRNGPVFNLSDFGAIANGDSPSASGPDRNLQALKAAIAKCRETKASKLTVPKGVYRITSGESIAFEGLNDFIFDGGGSTFLFDQIKGGPGISIKRCNRSIFCNFNLDWDWKKDPLASVGRISKVTPGSPFFEMHFDTPPPLDPTRWLPRMSALDEKLLAPGKGIGFVPRRIDSIDPLTVRIWPSQPVVPIVGQPYLVRHYDFEKHGIVMYSNAHLSFQNVTIYSFPGIGFVVGGDQHHFELLHCCIAYPEKEHRSMTATGGGLWLGQSQGFIKLEDCDFGHTGDDCVDIHDNFQKGIRVVDGHTVVAEKIVAWKCPFTAGDLVEIRNGDYSPTGFTGKLAHVKPGDKSNELTLVFEQQLPSHIGSDAMLFNHRYGSHNCIIRHCYFHENRAHGVLCSTADWLIEENRFFHNQLAALHVDAEAGVWCQGFGARNVVISGNKIESANSGEDFDGAAVFVGANVGDHPTSYPLLQDIIFENNVIQETTGPAIEAASFKNLVISKNSVINREKAQYALKMRGSIRAQLGSGFWLTGNQWSTGNGITSPSFSYDAETTKNIVCKDNLLGQ